MIKNRSSLTMTTRFGTCKNEKEASHKSHMGNERPTEGGNVNQGLVRVKFQSRPFPL